MQFYLASLVALVGIGACVALHYAWIGLRRREAGTQRIFAALAAVLAVYSSTNAALQADPQWALAHGAECLSRLCEMGATGLLLAFVARFTGQDHRRLRLGLSAALGLVAIAALVLPQGLRSGPITGLHTTMMPWGEGVHLITAPYGLTYALMLGLVAACFVYCGVAAWRAWRASRAGRQLSLLVALVIIAAAVVNGVVIDLTSWPTVPLIAHSFILLAVIMGHALSAELARAGELEAHLRRAEHFAAVGRLAGGVAHDFGNVLTAILGHAELLAEKLEHQPSVRFHATTIATAAGRGTALTRQLLAFARGSPAGEAHNRADSHAILSEVAGLVRAGAAGIEVQLDLDPVGGAVACDPARLHAALLNLAVNARDAMPRGGILRLSTARRSPPPGTSLRHTPLPDHLLLEIAVSDTGLGIPAEVLPHIFDLLYSTKGDLGTGLGLAQVDDTVRATGGGLAVETAAGTGTTFRLWLPLREEPGSGLYAPGRARVLLVAGSTSLDQVLASGLDQLGYTIARLGSDDLQHLCAAVVDIDHAGDDGLAQVHALQDRLAVVVLADDPSQWPSSEGTIVLPKPADLGALGRALRQATKAGRKRGTTSAQIALR